MNLSRLLKYNLFILLFFLSFQCFGQNYQRMQISKSDLQGIELMADQSEYINAACVDYFRNIPDTSASLKNILTGASDVYVKYLDSDTGKEVRLDKLLKSKKIQISGYDKGKYLKVSSIIENDYLSKKEKLISYLKDEINRNDEKKVLLEYLLKRKPILKIENFTGHRIQFIFKGTNDRIEVSHKEELDSKYQGALKDNLNIWENILKSDKDLLDLINRYSENKNIGVLEVKERLEKDSGKEIKSVADLKRILKAKIKAKKEVFHQRVLETFKDKSRDIGISAKGKTADELIIEYKATANKPLLKGEALLKAVIKDQKDKRYYFYDRFSGKYFSNLKHPNMGKVLFTERAFTKKYLNRFVDELFKTNFDKGKVLILDMVGEDAKMAKMLGGNYMAFSSKNFSELSKRITRKQINFIIPIAHFNSKGMMIDGVSKTEFDPKNFDNLAKLLNVKLFYGGCYSHVHTKGSTGAKIEINRKILLETIAENLDSKNLGEFYKNLSESYNKEYTFIIDVDPGNDIIIIKGYRKKKQQESNYDHNSQYEYNQESSSIKSENEEVDFVFTIRGGLSKPIHEILKESEEDEN